MSGDAVRGSHASPLARTLASAVFPRVIARWHAELRPRQTRSRRRRRPRVGARRTGTVTACAAAWRSIPAPAVAPRRPQARSRCRRRDRLAAALWQRIRHGGRLRRLPAPATASPEPIKRETIGHLASGVFPRAPARRHAAPHQRQARSRRRMAPACAMRKPARDVPDRDGRPRRSAARPARQSTPSSSARCAMARGIEAREPQRRATRGGFSRESANAEIASVAFLRVIARRHASPTPKALSRRREAPAAGTRRDRSRRSRPRSRRGLRFGRLPRPSPIGPRARRGFVGRNVGRRGRASRASPLARDLASGIFLRALARLHAAPRRRKRARGAGRRPRPDASSRNRDGRHGSRRRGQAPAGDSLDRSSVRCGLVSRNLGRRGRASNASPLVRNSDSGVRKPRIAGRGARLRRRRGGRFRRPGVDRAIWQRPKRFETAQLPDTGNPTGAGQKLTAKPSRASFRYRGFTAPILQARVPHPASRSGSDPR
jgi:hypothetical protein